MTFEIIQSINKTRDSINHLNYLPEEKGIYAFYLNNSTNLKKFGVPGQLIYVGMSDKSLNSRDTKTHLKTGQTGWSTFRRSLGAILKVELKLIAMKRDIDPKKLRPDKYKFDEGGEIRLTEWMINSLEIGYWATSTTMTKDQLRKEEEKVIIMLKPTLDLDRRTKKLNYLAIELENYREICKQEVKERSRL